VLKSTPQGKLTEQLFPAGSTVDMKVSGYFQIIMQSMQEFEGLKPHFQNKALVSQL
jgi:hypothetical protein